MKRDKLSPAVVMYTAAATFYHSLRARCNGAVGRENSAAERMGAHALPAWVSEIESSGGGPCAHAYIPLDDTRNPTSVYVAPKDPTDKYINIKRTNDEPRVCMCTTITPPPLKTRWSDTYVAIDI